MVFGFDLVGDGDDVGVLNTAPDMCKRCFDEEGMEVELDREQRYNAVVGAYLDVVTCPQCGREVVASAEMTTPEGERF